MTGGDVEVDDGELAARALAGREEGYRALMARHRESVYRMVHAQISDADAAVDVTQESFIAAFAHLARYDPARPFRHWIMRIALNKCRDWRRRRAVRGFFSRAQPLEEEGVHVADSAPGPEAEAAGRRQMAQVRRAINAMPDNLRSILLLRTVEGMSQAEVAMLLGLSEKAVETRLYRARVKLSEMVRDFAPPRV